MYIYSFIFYHLSMQFGKRTYNLEFLFKWDIQAINNI